MRVTNVISMLEQINDILHNTVITPYTAAVKLLISFLLGAVIGIERQFRRREAGMRTFTLICIWVMAVIGLAVGAGMYIPAAIATVITLFILVSLEHLERRMFLNGVNKILTITCSTATPDLKAVRKILESKGVFIVSVSFETYYKEDRSVITYKVNVKAISSYTNLFNDIRSLGIVTQIRLMA